MSLATGEGEIAFLISTSPRSCFNIRSYFAALIEADGQDREVLFSKMAAKYIECMKDMDGRAPGKNLLIDFKTFTTCVRMFPVHLSEHYRKKFTAAYLAFLFRHHSLFYAEIFKS